MYINIHLDKMIAKIRLPQGRNDNLMAFGSIWFYEPDAQEPIFRVKGFTIRKFLSKETGTYFLKISSPAYRAGKGFVTSFLTENLDLLGQIRKALLTEYYQQVGDNPYGHPEQEVKPEDIPF